MQNSLRQLAWLSILTLLLGSVFSIRDEIWISRDLWLIPLFFVFYKIFYMFKKKHGFLKTTAFVFTFLSLYNLASSVHRSFYYTALDVESLFYLSPSLVIFLNQTYGHFFSALLLFLFLFLFFLAYLVFKKLIAKALSPKIDFRLWFKNFGILTLLLFAASSVSKNKIDWKTKRGGAGHWKKGLQLLSFQSLFENSQKKQFAKEVAAVESLDRAHASSLFQKGDVFIFDVESYSAVFLENPNYKKVIQKELQDLSALAEQKQLTMQTGRMVSPVYGKKSWMAEMTFNCGIKVNSQWKFKTIFKTQIQCLSKIFKNSGFSTYDLRGSTTQKKWQEARFFYGFQNNWYRHKFSYKGKKFGFSLVPDNNILQEASHHFNQTNSNKNKYVLFQLSSSHYPYNEIPKMEYGEISHNTPSSVKFQSTPEGYKHAIKYSLSAVLSFLKKQLKSSDTVIIFGDHPPVFSATGSKSFHVPIHIISSKDFKLKNSMEQALPMEQMKEKVLTSLKQKKSPFKK